MRFGRPGAPALFGLACAPGRRTWVGDGRRGGQGQEVLSPSLVLDKAPQRGVEADGCPGRAHMSLFPNPPRGVPIPGPWHVLSEPQASVLRDEPRGASAQAQTLRAGTRPYKDGGVRRPYEGTRPCKDSLFPALSQECLPGFLGAEKKGFPGLAEGGPSCSAPAPRAWGGGHK